MTWPTTSKQSRGYGGRWQVLRAQALRRDCWLCQACLAAGRITSATEVHHLVERAAGGADTLGNVVSICHACHQRATTEAKGGKVRPAFDRHGRPVDPAHTWAGIWKPCK